MEKFITPVHPIWLSDCKLYYGLIPLHLLILYFIWPLSCNVCLLNRSVSMTPSLYGRCNVLIVLSVTLTLSYLFPSYGSGFQLHWGHEFRVLNSFGSIIENKDETHNPSIVSTTSSPYRTRLNSDLRFIWNFFQTYIITFVLHDYTLPSLFLFNSYRL